MITIAEDAEVCPLDVRICFGVDLVTTATV